MKYSASRFSNIMLQNISCEILLDLLVLFVKRNKDNMNYFA